MAIKESFRYNASQKEYQIISDFSKGMNTADGDSILTDNTARNVTNFDIDAGAILTKRHGMSPLLPSHAMLQKHSALFGETPNDNDTFETYFNFNRNTTVSASFNMITWGEIYSKFIEKEIELGISKWLSFAPNHATTFKEFINLDNNWNSSLNTEALITQSKQDITDEEGKLLFTSSDFSTFQTRIWKYLTIKDVQKHDGNVITYEIIPTELVKDLANLAKHPDLLGEGYSPLEIKFINFTKNIHLLLNFILNNDGTFDLTCTYLPIWVNDKTFFRFDEVFKTTYIATWNQLTPSDNTGFWVNETTFYKWDEKELNWVTYNPFPTLVNGYQQANNVSDRLAYVPTVDEYNSYSYNLLSLQSVFNRNYTETYSLGLDLLPRGTSSLQGMIEVVPIAKDDNITTYLTKPLLINSLLPYVNGNTYNGYYANDRVLNGEVIGRKGTFNNNTEIENLKYSAFLKKNINDDKKYAVGYQLVTLDEWTAQQSGLNTKLYDSNAKPVDTFTDYKNIVIKEAFKQNGIVNKTTTGVEHEYSAKDITYHGAIIGIDMEVKIPSTEPHVLEMFAFPVDTLDEAGVEKALTAMKSPDQMLSEKLNINATVQEPAEYNNMLANIKRFYDTDKDLFYKNQMFRYGNSNTIFVSDVNNSYYFPLLNYLTLPTQQEVISIVPYYNQLLVQTKTQQFVIEGNSPEDFKVKDLNSDIGAFAPLATKPNINYIFQLSAAGVYRTKSTYNFADRYNADKMDNAIAGQIKLDRDACAIVHDDKYYLHIPSTGEIWIYYNQFNSWTRHFSSLFKFKRILTVDETLVFPSSEFPGIMVFNNEWTDKRLSNIKPNWEWEPVISTYKSKEVDFGLPNHDKKFKEMHVAFEDTPKANAIYVNAWVDGSQVISYRSDELVSTAITNIYGQPDVSIERKVVETNQIETLAQAQYDNGNFDKALFDNDQNQQHKVIISGRGKALQFEVVHKENKQMKIRNFGTVIKVKKPKARFKE